MFINFRFMPILKYIMENAVHKDLRLLRGKTIECISLIGLAVGKDKFIRDVDSVMNLLLRTQTQNNTGDTEDDDDDPQVCFLSKCCVCTFIEYLIVVVVAALRVGRLSR